jgi:hypothetical protein
MFQDRVETEEGTFEIHIEGSRRFGGYYLQVYYGYLEENGEWHLHPVCEDGEGGYALAAGGFALSPDSIKAVEEMMADLSSAL